MRQISGGTWCQDPEAWYHIPFVLLLVLDVSSTYLCTY